jgi:hypothetical protein
MYGCRRRRRASAGALHAGVPPVPEGMSRELSELLGSMGAGVIRLLLVVVAAIAAAVDAGPTAGPDWHEQSAGESKAKTSRSATPIPPGFGPQQVWRLSRAATAELHRCTDPISVDCVQRVMERHGGSAGALEFYRRTGWLLSKLKVTGGPVMLATVVNPWRANENEQPALLSGNSVVVYPEEVEVPLENDAGFKALKARFPRLMFWKPGPTLESNEVTKGGQSFVFRYRLLDGCHACAIRGWARIEFDFAPDGTYRRAKVLGVAHHRE